MKANLMKLDLINGFHVFKGDKYKGEMFDLHLLLFLLQGLSLIKLHPSFTTAQSKSYSYAQHRIIVMLSTNSTVIFNTNPIL